MKKYWDDLSKKLNITFDNTIIIGGKGPSLDIFIKNYELYSKFKKISLNDSFFNDDIKYDYMIIGDSQNSVATLKMNTSYKYNKYLLSKIHKHYSNIDQSDSNSHIKIIIQKAKEKNLKVILAINKFNPFWNQPVKWAKENNMYDDLLYK